MRIFAAILLLISSAALAQSGLKYRVEIVAPKDMQKSPLATAPRW